MLTLVELLNREEDEFSVGFSNEVDYFEHNVPVRDTEADKIDTPLTDDPVEIGDVETVAFEDVSRAG